MQIETTYLGNKRFQSGEAIATVTMDAGAPAGGLGEAPNPKKMVLHGLAGCTGLDVVAILEKKKVEYDHFSISVEVTQSNTHPKVFKTIDMVYRFTADEADRAAIERAIELSKKQFCGVSAMLEKTATINFTLKITPR